MNMQAALRLWIVCLWTGLVACGGSPTELRSTSPDGQLTAIVTGQRPVPLDPWEVRLRLTLNDAQAPPAANAPLRTSRQIDFKLYVARLDESTVTFEWPQPNAGMVTFRLTNGSTRRMAFSTDGRTIRASEMDTAR